MTDPQSPSSSGPPTPAMGSIHFPSNHSHNLPSPISSPSIQPTASADQGPAPPPNYTYPHHPVPPQGYPNQGLPPNITPAIPASALPGARLSGRLVGVVSLTDILFLYAKTSGLSPNDPAETRNRRRRSSSSSVSVRKSGDIGRELFRSGP